VPAHAAREIALVDLIELDMGYTTITDQYYQAVAPQALLDGARVGMVAYLRGVGVENPQIAIMHARRDGRGVVPAIEQQLGKAIDRYGARVDARNLVYSAIRGELAALRDPYSVFFTKPELTGFTTALDGKSFGGIGIVIAGDAAQHYRADQVFEGSPAGRAGIVAGDRIIAIGGKAVDGLTTDAISALLRGPVGTVVRIEVRADGDAASRELAITRAAITPPDVTARILSDRIAYVALRTFGPTAGQQVQAALVRLRAQGARATIFDLRGNGGGYESSAVHVASAFVASGSIVVTQTNHGHRLVTSADGKALAPLPLVVLVDHDSASGSELVTGAIQDHRLGKIVGARTFGKGLVQTMFPLPDGSAMKVTTARYFTPDGRDIDHIGITPDMAVDEPANAVRGVPGHDPQLDVALALLTAQVGDSLALPARYR
jgi:carboxyl-terminal processing protease